MVDTSKTTNTIPMAIITTPEELSEASEDYMNQLKLPMIIPVATSVAIENYTDDSKFTSKFNNQELNYDKMLEKLGHLFSEYEVPIGLLSKLCALSEYNISIVIDDSGSMSQKTDSTRLDAMTSFMKEYYRANNLSLSSKMTRFEEEEDRLHLMIEFLAYIPTGPINVMCMNRQNEFILIRDNKTPEKFLEIGHTNIRSLFTNPPSGCTPTMEVMKHVFSTSKGKTSHYLFTDGVPSDCNTNDLGNFLAKRANPQMNPLTFISCTDVDSEAEWMKEIEEIGPYMSEIDDYKDELKEVLHDQGRTFPYSKGFWFMCLLVGSINPYDLDAMDDSTPFTKYTIDNLLGRPVTREEYSRYWNEHPKSKEFSNVADRFATEQKHAADVLANKPVPTATTSKRLSGLMSGLMSKLR